MLDYFVKYECNPEVLQFTGGGLANSTTYNEMIHAVKARNIVLVILTSKGARIANEEEFVKKPESLGVYVYLLFDDFKKSTDANIRGEDAGEIKDPALADLAKYRVGHVLACTLQKGVNESEGGPVVDLAMERSFFRGVVFQLTFCVAGPRGLTLWILGHCLTGPGL